MRLTALLSSTALSSLILLGACHKPQVAPAPHYVAVRYSGANLADLHPRLAASGAQRGGPGAVFYLDSELTNVNGTTDLYQVPAGYDFSVLLSCFNLTPPQRLPAGAYLKAELLVDNQVRKTVVLDGSAPNDHGYVTTFTSLLHNEW